MGLQNSRRVTLFENGASIAVLISSACDRQSEPLIKTSTEYGRERRILRMNLKIILSLCLLNELGPDSKMHDAPTGLNIINQGLLSAFGIPAARP
jgi:hypothetical protein